MGWCKGGGWGQSNYFTQLPARYMGSYGSDHHQLIIRISEIWWCGSEGTSTHLEMLFLMTNLCKERSYNKHLILYQLNYKWLNMKMNIMITIKNSEFNNHNSNYLNIPRDVEKGILLIFNFFVFVSFWWWTYFILES